MEKSGSDAASKIMVDPAEREMYLLRQSPLFSLKFVFLD